MIILRGSREEIEDFAGNRFYLDWDTLLRCFNRYHWKKNVPPKLLDSVKILRSMILEIASKTTSQKVNKKLTELAELFQQITVHLSSLQKSTTEVDFSIQKEQVEREIIRARALIILLSRRLKDITKGDDKKRIISNNSALIIVHPEKAHLDEDIAYYGEGYVIQTRNLFTNIAHEIELSLSERKKVYYLAEISTSVNSPQLFPAIREHLKKLIFVPFGASLENQLLRVKKMLLEESIENVEICGVMRDVCVKELYDLLRARVNRESQQEYEIQSKRLGWSKEGLAVILKKRISATILTELTY